MPSSGTTKLHNDSIKVTILRSHLVKSTSSPAEEPLLKWKLQNPSHLLVHVNDDEERPIFVRSNVVVNSRQYLNDQYRSSTSVQSQRACTDNPDSSCGSRQCTETYNKICSERTSQARISDRKETERRGKQKRCTEEERGRERYNTSSSQQCRVNYKCSHLDCSFGEAHTERDERSSRSHSDRRTSKSCSPHSLKRSCSPHSQKVSRRSFDHSHSTNRRSVSRANDSPYQTKLSTKCRKCSKSPVSKTSVSGGYQKSRSRSPLSITTNAELEQKGSKPSFLSNKKNQFTESPDDDCMSYAAGGFWIPAMGPRFMPPFMGVPPRGAMNPRLPFINPRPFMFMPHTRHRFIPYGLPTGPRMRPPITSL